MSDFSLNDFFGSLFSGSIFTSPSSSPASLPDNGSALDVQGILIKNGLGSLWQDEWRFAETKDDLIRMGGPIDNPLPTRAEWFGKQRAARGKPLTNTDAQLGIAADGTPATKVPGTVVGKQFEAPAEIFATDDDPPPPTDGPMTTREAEGFTPTVPSRTPSGVSFDWDYSENPYKPGTGDPRGLSVFEVPKGVQMVPARTSAPPNVKAVPKVVPPMSLRTAAAQAVAPHIPPGTVTRTNSTHSGTWTSRNATWAALDDHQKAVAMGLLEAGYQKIDNAKNAVAAMFNRATKEGVPLGKHVSSRLYQPTFEPAQEKRLDAALKSPNFTKLLDWAKRYSLGMEPDPTNGATHFLVHPRVMLSLEAGEPNKYRSWRSWTGFDQKTMSYKNQTYDDGLHAFLAPHGRFTISRVGGPK